jgi:hypothetical protein
VYWTRASAIEADEAPSGTSMASTISVDLMRRALPPNQRRDRI